MQKKWDWNESKNTESYTVRFLVKWCSIDLPVDSVTPICVNTKADQELNCPQMSEDPF